MLRYFFAIGKQFGSGYSALQFKFMLLEHAIVAKNALNLTYLGCRKICITVCVRTQEKKRH